MSESLFEQNQHRKTSDFTENDILTNLLSILSENLKPVQKNIQEYFSVNKWPLGFIVGCPRSGTTLFLQWLSSLGPFAYPTNVLNRFAYAPYLGALIQKMLFVREYDPHAEVFSLEGEFEFTSNLGKTSGPLAANEFQHYFRNYMPNFDPEYLSLEMFKKVDLQGIKKGLISIENAFGKPFILKAIMLQFNLDELNKTIPKSIFMYIKRSPLNNMQSLLFAREKYYSDKQIWWSVKPKEYSFLKDQDVFHQIAGQVFYTNKAIKEKFKEIESNRKMIVEYEEFCSNPKQYYNEIRMKYAQLGFDLERKYQGPKNFKVSNTIKLSPKEADQFEKAYREIETADS